MKSPTYNEIAGSWSLWTAYMDPSGTMSRDEFDALTVDERIAMIVASFGPEAR